MQKNVMVSIIVLCYRRFDFIFEAIDSVIEQEYKTIELLVSDDGSDYFPKEEIEWYIRKNKKENIVNFIIHQESKNVGTVKHLNNAIALAKGEFIVALAADDAFFDNRVIEKYVDGFLHAGDDCYIEMAQTAMYDHRLKNIDGYFLQPKIKQALEQRNYNGELFRLLSYDPYLPSTSTCFRKTFFEKFGKFNEKYLLVEDVPMHLRLAREQWSIHYENFVAIKHRTGGISHGNVGGSSRSQYLYYTDLVNISKNEIVPYYNLIDKDYLQEIKNVVKYKNKWCIEQLSYYPNKRERLKFLIHNPKYLVKIAMQGLYGKTIENIFKYILFGIVLQIVAPIVGEMIDMQWNSQGIMIENILYMISLLFIDGGTVIASLNTITKFIANIEAFPNESLTI